MKKSILLKIALLYIFAPLSLLAQLATPSNLDLYPLSSTSVSLNWQDNSNAANGFKIFRDGKLIFIVEPDVTHYVDTGLKPHTTYTIKESTQRSYFISKNGNDNNPGTQAQPWATFKKAVDTLEAGDTVWIKKGTYHEQVWIWKSGNATDHIAYRSFPNHQVIIDGRAPTPQIVPNDNNEWWGGVFGIGSANYIDIIGLTIRNSSFGGIWVSDAQHIMIEDCHTGYTVSSGIYAEDSNYVTINNNEVAHACSYPRNEDVANECISIVDTNHTVVSNNNVHHNVANGIDGGEGIDVKVGSFDVTVTKNHVHHITNRIGIYVDAWTKNTSNIRISQNYIHDISDVGISLASEQGGALSNIWVENNIVYNASSNGIEVGSANGGLGGSMSNMKIVNNTVFKNGHGTGDYDAHKGIMINAGASNILIRNNIVSRNGYQQIVTEGSAVVDHNYKGANSNNKCNFLKIS